MYSYRSSSITVGGLAETTHVSELHTNVQMYALAEKYDFADLRVEAIHKFNYFLNGKLEEQKTAELSTVLTSIPDIYNTTPESDRGLRDSIVAYGVEHWQAILKVPDLHDVVPTQFCRRGLWKAPGETDREGLQQNLLSLQIQGQVQGHSSRLCMREMGGCVKAG